MPPPRLAAPRAHALCARALCALALCAALSAARAAPPRQGAAAPDDFLRALLDEAGESPNPRAQGALRAVLADPARYRFQLLVTELDPQTGALTPHELRVDREYLYPASAIKTFASLAALVYFKELREAHPWLSLSDPLGFHPTRCVQRDPTHLKHGRVTLKHELKKTQLVSSNSAFNRVFDVVGSERLHAALLPLFPSVRVYHRLSTNETHEESLTVPPLSICDAAGGAVSGARRVTPRPGRVTLSDQNAPALPAAADPYSGFGAHPESLQVGRAYVDFKTGRRVEGPLDFTYKNRASLYDFQLLTAGIFAPHATHRAFGRELSLRALAIPEEWLDALRKAMTLYPRQSKNPKYSGEGLSETRFKPLMRGLRAAGVTDERLYYLNKAGKALGFHLDNALVGVGGEGALRVDRATSLPAGAGLRRALYVTVGLYVNDDEVLNDDVYEYDSVSAPLLDALGYGVGRYLQGDGRFKARAPSP